MIIDGVHVIKSEVILVVFIVKNSIEIEEAAIDPLTYS